MKNHLTSRNVTIDGNRTSIRLEEDIWEAFDEICERENLSSHELVTLIEERREGTNRTSAVRAFIVTYYRMIANERTSRRDDGNGGRLIPMPRKRVIQVSPRVKKVLAVGG